MNIPEEFGKYLLLKKLTEDPLGETFRAGKVGQGGMEQVVLLRVFNGKGIDGEKLWSKISGRGAVHEILKSPNIGKGVDLGRVRSFPYTAYDYISGKNLATLFAQAARQFSPVPTDHALLIAERISLALAAAHESRLQDERVLHGS
jgi:eukaryotic-like serine/threonine-protein kinase